MNHHVYTSETICTYNSNCSNNNIGTCFEDKLQLQNTFNTHGVSHIKASKVSENMSCSFRMNVGKTQMCLLTYYHNKYNVMVDIGYINV